MIATTAAIIKYHRKIGMNLEIRNTDRMIHKQPAYRLYVYLIVNPPIYKLHQKQIKLYII